jgi:hypothetical protein
MTEKPKRKMTHVEIRYFNDYWAGLEDADHSTFYKAGVQESYVRGFVDGMKHAVTRADAEAEKIYDRS